MQVDEDGVSGVGWWWCGDNAKQLMSSITGEGKGLSVRGKGGVVLLIADAYKPPSPPVRKSLALHNLVLNCVVSTLDSVSKRF